MASRTKRTARLALLAAIGTVLTFLGHIIPAGRLGLILLASFPVCIALMMYGRGWAAAVYVVTAALCLLLFPGAASIGFVCFFGYFPILKSLMERLHSLVLVWVLKYVLYSAVFAAYWLLARTLFLPGLEGFPWYLIYIGGAVVYGVYDWCYSLVIKFYIDRVARYFRP